MQAMIDHVAAVVIGATLLLLVFALSARTQDSAVEATQVALGKAELRSLIDVIEQDFNNMGSGLGRANAGGGTRVITMRGPETVGGDTYQAVKFYALADNDAAMAPPDLVTYRWRQDGTATFPDGSTTNLFEVQRESDGQVASFGNVSTFAITLRYDEHLPVTPAAFANPDSLAQVRYVAVDLGMISPAGTENLIQQTRWTKLFRPINLEPLNRRIIASPP